MSRRHEWTPKTELGHLNDELDHYYDLNNGVVDHAPEGEAARLRIESSTPGANASITLRVWEGTNHYKAGTWRTVRGRGTKDVPAAITNYDVIGQFNFAGYYSETQAPTTAYIRAQATEDWSAGNLGTALAFIATPNGSSSVETAMTIAGGAVEITNSPTEDTHAARKDYVDGAVSGVQDDVDDLKTNRQHWIPVDEMPDIESTTTPMWRGDMRHHAFPDGDTCRKTYGFAIPPGWDSHNVSVSVYYFGNVTGDNYRLEDVIHNIAEGASVDAGGTTRTVTVAGPSTANVLEVYTFANFWVANGTKYLRGKFGRLGTDAADTNTGQFRLMGILLTLEV